MTEPADDTLAMLGDNDVHETASPVNTAPDASFAVALACETLPTVSEEESIATTTDATTGGGGGGGVVEDAFTTIEDVPSNVPTAAFTTAVPAAIAVTAPEGETVATFVASELHVTVWPERGLPVESLTTADAVATWPTVMDGESIATATTAGRGSCTSGAFTATGMLAMQEPSVARIATVPIETAVTNPVDVTVATFGSSELQLGL